MTASASWRDLFRASGLQWPRSVFKCGSFISTHFPGDFVWQMARVCAPLPVPLSWYRCAAGPKVTARYRGRPGGGAPSAVSVSRRRQPSASAGAGAAVRAALVFCAAALRDVRRGGAWVVSRVGAAGTASQVVLSRRPSAAAMAAQTPKCRAARPPPAAR